MFCRGLGDEIPRQQFVDAIDGMIGNLCQHLAQIAFGIYAVEFGRADQAINRRRPFAAHLRAGKQIILAVQSDSAQGALRCVVVDFDATVVTIPRQRHPA